MVFVSQSTFDVSAATAINMEELKKKHRQEQKDLQSRITQKKKNATKKTRKGVNDECAALETELKEKQDLELQSLNGDSSPANQVEVPTDDAVVDQCVLPKGEPTDTSVEPVDASLKSFSISASAPENGHMKKPNRQKAKLARRAAEQEAAAEKAEKEAADLPNLREKERESMRQAYETKSLVEREIRSDGHCLYAAVADQLLDSNVELSSSSISNSNDISKEISREGYKTTRDVAANYIQQHADDFLPFLEEPLESYVRTVRETGEWGGHVEILALAKAYKVNINVLQANGRTESVNGSSESEVSSTTLWLAYYHHNYGLGEHYNSLRKKRNSTMK